MSELLGALTLSTEICDLWSAGHSGRASVFSWRTKLLRWRLTCFQSGPFPDQGKFFIYIFFTFNFLFSFPSFFFFFFKQFPHPYRLKRKKSKFIKRNQKSLSLAVVIMYVGDPTFRHSELFLFVNSYCAPLFCWVYLPSITEFTFRFRESSLWTTLIETYKLKLNKIFSLIPRLSNLVCLV